MSSKLLIKLRRQEKAYAKFAMELAKNESGVGITHPPEINWNKPYGKVWTSPDGQWVYVLQQKINNNNIGYKPEWTLLKHPYQFK
jgi:hypothetical protein